MKSVTIKTLMSLAVISIAALLLAAALLVGGRAVALSHGAQDDLLLVALTLGGAAASMVNNFGRSRTGNEKETAQSKRSTERSNSTHCFQNQTRHISFSLRSGKPARIASTIRTNARDAVHNP
jgi:hypothetical protein